MSEGGHPRRGRRRRGGGGGAVGPENVVPQRGQCIGALGGPPPPSSIRRLSLSEAASAWSVYQMMRHSVRRGFWHDAWMDCCLKLAAPLAIYPCPSAYKDELHEDAERRKFAGGLLMPSKLVVSDRMRGPNAEMFSVFGEGV